jgi:hypothetical protein
MLIDSSASARCSPTLKCSANQTPIQSGTMFASQSILVVEIPARELHFLGLLANHDQEHKSEHNAR